MAMRHGEDIRRALIERVASRVEGQGIGRASIDAAVDGVLGALANRTGASAAPAPLQGGGGLVVAAVSGRSAPDLGSRLRAALGREGVDVSTLGIATRGRHTVVTLQLPAAARQALERVAAEHSLALSFDPALQPLA